MGDYIILMHADAVEQESDAAWQAYLDMLRASGAFGGGSAIGAGVSLIYQKGINPPPPLPEAVKMMEWMPYGIVVIALALLCYAFAMAKKGVLR